MTKKQPISASGFSVKESVFWYILLPLLLSIFISFMLILQIRLLLRNAEDVVRSQAVISQAYIMQKTILDMETGLRGYYITGNKDFLDPYYSGNANVDKELTILNKAVADSRDETPRFDEVISLLKVWQDYSKARIEQRKNARWMPSDKYSDGGKRIMDKIRAHLDEIITSQQSSSIKRRQLVEDNTNIAVILTVTLSILLSALLSFSLYRRIRFLANSFNTVLHELTTAKNKIEDINMQLENTVEERTISLRAANSELEAFCYSVSHDLRAPLRGIDGFSLALAEDYTDKVDDAGKKYISYIRQGVQRMGRLIDDLLNLSRITRLDLKKTQVNLTTLFQEVSRETRSNNPQDTVNEFSFVVEDNLLAFGDEGLLRIVLENLISNAWKFSKNKPAPQVTMGRIRLPDGRNAFFIKDNGVGFDMAFKDKLFQAFQRLHSASEYSGTGIGLATVKRIILKHGGDIWVESQLDHGTTFFIVLPESIDENEQ